MFGHALVDWIAEYRSNLPKLRVMSDRKPGEIRALLPTQPPSEPEPMESLLADLRRVVLPGMTHWSHPSFFAYFPSNSSLPSVLADLVASGLGAQSMSWQTSPAATELEEVMMDWLRRMVGLPETFTGVLQDTASTSTLVALICARERTSRLAQMKQGLQASHPAMTVYAPVMLHRSATVTSPFTDELLTRPAWPLRLPNESHHFDNFCQIEVKPISARRRWARSWLQVRITIFGRSS